MRTHNSILGNMGQSLFLKTNRMKKTRLLALVSVVSIGHLLCGCSTLPNGREWGQDATFNPGWEAVREVALRIKVLKPSLLTI
jgi:hypothetical protein